MTESRDFWLNENRRYAEPYFRLEKCARIVNALSHGQPCDLLDLGCGPATLGRLVGTNIRYYGLDVAIHDAAQNLRELDIVQNEIAFDGRLFDIVVAAGLFEYLGGQQRSKLAEIFRLLKPDGRLVVTYTNFDHIHIARVLDGVPWNNRQSLEMFKADLESLFRVESWFPSSHNWFPSEPSRRWLKAIQMPLMMSIPILSRRLALNYFFICSRRGRAETRAEAGSRNERLRLG